LINTSAKMQSIDRYYGYETERLIAEIKQRIKEACEFYLRYRDKPELFAKEREEHEVRQYIREVEKILDHKNFYWVMGKLAKFEYNDWLFRLAFGLREDEDGKE